MSESLKDLREEALRKLFDSPELLEELASLEHQQWSMLMAYIKSVSIEEKDIVEQLQSKWKEWRQLANTPYANLTEKQKESDRIFARDTLKILKEKVFDETGYLDNFLTTIEMKIRLKLENEFAFMHIAEGRRELLLNMVRKEFVEGRPLLVKLFSSEEKVLVSRKQLENIRDFIEAHQERIGFYGKGVYDLTIWLLGNLPLETFYADHVEHKELLAGSVGVEPENKKGKP